MTEDEVQKRSEKILADAGLTALSIEPLQGGRNNLVFKVVTGKDDLLLKLYFWHEHDQRDRLKAEYSFLEYAKLKEIKSIANPILCDTKNRVALYSFIKGKKVAAGEVNSDAVDQAIRFIEEINHDRDNTQARSIGIASDACFSVQAHLDTIEKRLEQFHGLEVEDELDSDLKNFIEQSLRPTWNRVKNDVLSTFSKEVIESPLALGDRILSPSDFGFHNALESEDRIYFLDFEYAGWDDPAKTAGDFFNQVEIPVPLVFFDEFVTRVAQLTEDADFTQQRIRLLLPLYSIKWICIVLNYFLPVHRSRRNFAQVLDNKKIQLEKAKNIMDHKLRR